MPPEPGLPAVAVRDLVVRYGTRTAVAGLSFTAAAGQVTALVGPNGAGKTSTVEACVGLRRPTSGAVTVLGEQLRASGPTPGLRARVGVMLQDGGLYATARPLELLRHIASLYPRALDPTTLLDRLGVDPSTRTTIRRMSGGEQRRVAAAAALVGGPELAFLDEPTSGLDAIARRGFHDLIRELVAGGTTVILTTHDLSDVEKLCRRVMIIDEGRLLYDGQLEALAQRFGGSRQLVVELAEEYPSVEIDGAELVSWQGGQVVFEFDRTGITASELIGRLSAKYRIRDLEVREPSLEETIRRIYEQQLLR